MSNTTLVAPQFINRLFPCFCLSTPLTCMRKSVSTNVFYMRVDHPKTYGKCDIFYIYTSTTMFLLYLLMCRWLLIRLIIITQERGCFRWIALGIERRTEPIRHLMYSEPSRDSVCRLGQTDQKFDLLQIYQESKFNARNRFNQVFILYRQMSGQNRVQDATATAHSSA